MTDADRADRPGSVDGVGADVGRGSTVLADFAEYLRFEKGHSEHTIRAYSGDVRGLISFAGARGAAISAIDLGLLRAWLAEHTRRGAARTTVARQVSSAKTSARGPFAKVYSRVIRRRGCRRPGRIAPCLQC